MPPHRGWRHNYTNGDIVLSWYGHRPLYLLTTAHTGDGHHSFMTLAITDSVESPREMDHLVAQPNNQFHGYYIGPVVAQLDDDQQLRAESGIDIPKLRFTVAQLEEAQKIRPPRQRPLRHYTI